jgi:glutamyl-tRNA synthetase
MDSNNSGELQVDEKEIITLARKFALLNAIYHDGRASLGSVIGRVFAEQPKLKRFPQRVNSLVREQVEKVNSLPLLDQRRALLLEFPGAMENEDKRKQEISRKEAEREPSLPELPDAIEGAVVTRFPPEPNGYMHIGHAKAAIIGREYATRYSGKFIVRFDDTNPSTEKLEYYGAFLDSLEWLGIKADRVKNASDDMEEFYKLAEVAMRNGKAYVCTCAQEDIRQMRAKGLACAHRTNSVEENLKLWEKMKKKEFKRNEAVLRFLGDIKSSNTAMRDPVLFRIVEDPHPLRGTKYHIWPTYDFDGPVEDSLDGVTHAMRSKEYELRDEVYCSILNSLGLRVPKIIEFSRLSLANTTVHKRTLKRLVEEKKVDGWDDPRIPTIAGLRRRGILPEAIRRFIISMGLSKVESEPTWDLLESINRKLLDPVAKRYFFVPHPVSLDVKGFPRVTVEIPYHPDRVEFGSRKIETNGRFAISSEDCERLLPGSKIRLIEAYTVEIEESVGRTALLARMIENDLHGEDRGIKKLQWVARDSCTSFEMKVLGPLLKEGGIFNEKSLTTVQGLAEQSALELREGELVQFVRIGFCRIDKPGVAILTHK